VTETTPRDREPPIGALIDPRLASTRRHKARLGITGYVTLLAAARDKPCSYDDLQRAVGIGRTAVRNLVAALRSARLLHIAGWEQRYRAPFAALFSAGPGVDAAPPERRSNGRQSRGTFKPCKPTPTSSAVALAMLMRAIDAGPMTAEELAEHTGMSQLTVRSIVKALRQHSLAHIGAWDERSATGGASAARYALGMGKDAKPPPLVSREQINRQYREGKKARDEQLQVLRALAGALMSIDSMQEAA